MDISDIRMPDDEDPTRGWDKDLENIIRAVVSTENESMQKQKELDRMYELVETQKKKIAELEQAIEDQTKNVEIAASLPPDVELLKQRVGEQRNEINQKDALIEEKFVEINRLKSDLNFLRNQLNDASQEVQRASSESTTLRATLAENNKQLDEKIQELQAKTDTLAQIESNSSDALKLREDFQATQSNLLARENIILEMEAKISELEANLNQSQVAPENKEEMEKLRGELAAKDFDLKMQEGTITDLREQIEEAKRRAEMPDPNASRIDSLSKQLHQMHNDNAKLSLQVKVQEDQIKIQQAKIDALERSVTTKALSFSKTKIDSGPTHLTKRVILNTTSIEERHFEI